MDSPSAEQIAKLPKWARDHIMHLERQADTATRELQALTSETETEAFWQSYAHLDHGLPRRMFIPGGRFSLILGVDRFKQEHRIDFHLDRATDGSRTVQVMASHSGLRVYPHSSNVVHLSTMDPKAR